MYATVGVRGLVSRERLQLKKKLAFLTVRAQTCAPSARVSCNGFDTAEHRLCTFRALANPSYMSLTSCDPILSAFRLSTTLRRHGDADREHRADYEALAFEARAFAVRLMGLCRTSDEVELLLTRRKGCRRFFGSFPYARLLTAIDLGQREFVAHAHVQQILDQAWAGGWHEWWRYGTARKCSLLVVRLFLLPWIAFVWLFVPCSAGGRRHALPVNRMLNGAASYTLFLMALTAENLLDTSAWPEDDALSWILKTVVLLYGVSFAITATKRVLVQGPGRYLVSFWNVYECVKLAVLAGIVVCWWLMYATAQRYADDGSGLRELPPPDPAAPMAEGLLAVATTMSYLQLASLCQFHHALGMAHASLRRTAVDFSRFVALSGVAVVAIDIGLLNMRATRDRVNSTALAEEDGPPLEDVGSSFTSNLLKVSDTGHVGRIFRFFQERVSRHTERSDLLVGR